MFRVETFRTSARGVVQIVRLIEARAWSGVPPLPNAFRLPKELGDQCSHPRTTQLLRPSPRQSSKRICHVCQRMWNAAICNCARNSSAAADRSGSLVASAAGRSVRARCCWVLGYRFLQITRRGRKSGRIYRSVVGVAGSIGPSPRW